MHRIGMFLMVFMGIAMGLKAEDDEIRELKSFDRIEVSRGIEVLLTQGEENKALIVSEHMPLENIITEVNGSTLKISLTKMMFTEVMVQVRLDFSMLQKISANNSIVRSQRPLNISNLEVEADNGSLVELNLITEVLRVSATKGSVIKLEGKGSQLLGKSNTGSSIYASKLPSDNVEVSCGTKANFYVHANDKVVAKSTSGGVISVYGTPEKVEKSEAIGGKVYMKDLEPEDETGSHSS